MYNQKFSTYFVGNSITFSYYENNWFNTLLNFYFAPYMFLLLHNFNFSKSIENYFRYNYGLLY